uniref:B-cell receptor CD22 n=1 Tax=Seriola dumerili TaxID=41447 RepID=A0A3B4T9U0_SERDU
NATHSCKIATSPCTLSLLTMCSCFTFTSYLNTKTFWFTRFSDNEPVDLRADSEYSGRVQYHCGENDCTLRITDLRESDSAEYKFRFITNQPGGKYTGEPGVTLSVTGLQVKMSESKGCRTYPCTWSRLTCHSSCPLPDHPSYIWYESGKNIQKDAHSFPAYFYGENSYACAVKGHEDFPSPSSRVNVCLYPADAPKVSVLMNPSGDVMKDSSVNLTCSIDANPAAKYTWYKEKQLLLSGEPQLVFTSVQSSDSGEYYCTAENELGKTTSEHVSLKVKYGPQTSTLSVSPSGEIVEGSSVTLTCSSDANPAANYTWYKENLKLLQGPEGVYHFSSISSEDRGNYYCKSENKHGQINSASLFLDVQCE